MNRMRHMVWLVLGTVLAAGFPSSVAAQQLTPAERARIDSSAQALLQATGAPSASVAIVRGGEIVYERAYGAGRIDPETPATPAMRYAIGSVSKQFAATAILLLQEDGRLSLDDNLARWFPRLTRAGDISIRQLLSMTSGYQDYWPQDYVFPDMQRPATPQAIMERWAGIPLDFEPGARWQYSNTNYVIAAAIVERVSGMPFMDFLRRRAFTPLGMTSVANYDAGPLSASDAGMYLRHALGPLREAPKEARGWLFGAGQLAMTAGDLARWNIAVMDRSLLRPESYRTQQTDMLLTAGNATGYGLGVNVGAQGGRRRISHGGAVSGYTTTNYVYPDDRVAIVVFTNIYPGGGGASGQIAGRQHHLCSRRHGGRRRARAGAADLRWADDGDDRPRAADGERERVLHAGSAGRLRREPGAAGRANRVQRRWRVAAWRHDHPRLPDSRGWRGDVADDDDDAGREDRAVYRGAGGVS